MKPIVLAMHPVYAKAIANGEKTVELRKKLPVGVDTMYVYATTPIKRIIAVCKVRRLNAMTLPDLWAFSAHKACISREEFNKYYKGYDAGVCLEILEVKKVDYPLSAAGLSRAPQSYAWARSLLSND